jgi:hypothetical protein
MPTSWNVFLIGREFNDEDQLTEMLFWLISVAPAVWGVDARAGVRRGLLDWK